MWQTKPCSIMQHRQAKRAGHNAGCWQAKRRRCRPIRPGKVLFTPLGYYGLFRTIGGNSSLVENKPAARKSEDTLWSSLAIPGLAWKLAGRPVLRCSEQARESGKAVSSGTLGACCLLGRLRPRRRVIVLSGLDPAACQRQYQSYEIIISQPL